MRFSRKLSDSHYTLDAPVGDVRIDQAKMSAGCVFAAASLDRVGDIINIAGIDCEQHKLNPVSLWNHRSDDLDDVVGLTQDPDGNYTVILDPEAGTGYQTTYFSQKNLLAEQLYDRIVAREIRANSIGYRTTKRRKNSHGGFFLDALELLEVSWTIVGANADCVRAHLSRDRICGKTLHPQLRAAFEAQLQSNPTTKVTRGFVMAKINEKKAAAQKDLPPETPQETPAVPVETGPKLPAGAVLLTNLYAHLAAVIGICDQELPALENEDVEAAAVTICEGVYEKLSEIEALYAGQYPELPALPTVEKPAAEGESGEGESTEQKDEGEEEVEEEESEEGKSLPKSSGKTPVVGIKRLTKGMGNTIRECADHLNDMGTAENLDRNQRLACKYYGKALSEMVAAKDESAAPAETPEDDEVVAMEKAYNLLSPAEQAEFDAEISELYAQAEADDRAANLELVHNGRKAKAAAARAARATR